MSEKSPSTRQIKFLLPEEDHNAVRLAAAMRQMTMAEYCREIVMEDARELTKDIKIPPKGKKRPRSSN